MTLNQKVKAKLKTMGVTYNDFCTAIGMSRTGVDKMLDNHSIKSDVLEKMCNFLNVPTTFFVNIIEINKQNETKNDENITSKLLEIIEELRNDKKFLQEELKSKKDDLDFFKRIVSQKLGLTDKELAKLRTNEQGFSVVCGERVCDGGGGNSYCIGLEVR